MTILLKQIFALIKLLNSDTETRSIALGACVGFFLAMSPGFSLQTLIVILVLFFFRIQIGAAMLTAFFFGLVAYLLDPVFDRVGDLVLSQEALRPLFTTLYNLPLFPLTRFNNTIVMGGTVVALLCLPFVYLGTGLLVAKYRATVVARFKETKFWKGLKATGFYKWYLKYDEFFG